MTRKILSLITILILTTCSANCKPSPDALPKATQLPEKTNVLLITLDTTRADRIGCYGYNKASTPTLNALAAQGILFENAFSQVPLTLPSHTSMMTGKYPREHGIRVNGRNGLNPNFTTLATLFKQHGYSTGAIIAAGVLNSRYGLNLGFDMYNDDLDVLDQASSDSQRRGDSVSDDALTWLKKVKDKPFFTWIHYYDPHTPYEPPPPFGKPQYGPYDGEIAFMDTQIKRIIDFLDINNLRDRTLIVVVGDHGESLGEHGHIGHTIFLYRTNLHIPMILTHPSFKGPQRVNALVESVDIFPTILEYMGWNVPQDLLSRSLVNALTDDDFPHVASYAENHHPNWSYGWAEQRALTTHRWKYISSTIPELYDVTSDPHERNNVIAKFPEVAKQMHEALVSRYEKMTPGQASEITLDAEARRVLESLGYLSGGTQAISNDFLTADTPDPKNMLDVIDILNQARKHLKSDDPGLSIPLFLQAVNRSPNSISILILLGTAYQKVKKHEEAIKVFQSVVPLDPELAQPLALIAKSLASLEKNESAMQHYKAALALSDNDALIHAHYGKFLSKQGKLDDALKTMLRSYEINPTNPIVMNEIGKIYHKLGNPDRATEFYQLAVDADPNHARSCINLGMSLLQNGNTEEGIAYVKHAIQLDSSLSSRAITMAEHVSKQDIRSVEKALQVIADVPGIASFGKFNAGFLAEKRGDYQAAIKSYESVLQIDAGHEIAVKLLVELYRKSNDNDKIIKTLRAALPHQTENLFVLKTLSTLLATIPRDDLRDGDLAVELAERSIELTDRVDPVILAIAAAAYAETGKFDEAILIGTEAETLARQKNLTQLSDFIKTQMTGYRLRHPFRDRSLTE